MTADSRARNDPEDEAVPTDEARNIGLLARRALTPRQRHDFSERIVQRLLGLDELAEGARLALYLALEEEVALDRAVAPLRARRWHLHLPRLLGGRVDTPTTDAVAMEIVEWVPGAELRANRFGIGEVVDGPAVAPDEMEAFVVPCVAVDAQGNRVGFGAGYYDRMLASAPGVPRIGVAFEVQVVPRLAAHAWDVPMDVLVTERAVRRRGELG
jgi:5-formyltetrahydrofolate cyclo-ligase